MRQLRGELSQGGLARLSILGSVALAAGVAAGWVTISGPGPESSHSAMAATAPAQVIDTRFSSEWDEAALAPPAWFVAIREAEAQQFALLNPNPGYPVAAPVAPAASPEPVAGPALASASATPVIPKPSVRPKKASATSDHGVLNDAQIASIKQRLRLTPDQEAYWPAVEAALRELAWNKTQRARQQAVAQGAQAIDVNSPPVQRLKSAAFPLLMSFTDEQKQEVRELVHLIGLSKLAQEF